MSLKDKHIFILGTTKYDGADQSTSFNIAKELSKNNFVYYVDYPLTWKDLLSAKNRTLIRKRKSLFSPFSDGIIQTENPSLRIIITPPLLSINFLPEGMVYRMFLSINELIIRKRIKKALKRFKIYDYIFINSFNFHYPGVADKLRPALTVYHCVDPMIMDYDKKHGIISENELVRKSDLIICTSRQLFEEKIVQNPNTYFIPNAADLSQSSKALDESQELNHHVKDLEGPVIGYAGSIERRLDYPLLKEVIEMNPDKNFVFVGPVSKEFVPDWFFETKNIILTGRLPFSDMPGLLKGFDVAIIPFKKDEVSRTIFPLKLFEYLGAAKPVVATDFNPDLQEFTHGEVTFCKDSKQFSEALDYELKNENPEGAKQHRLNVAAENTWEKRGQAIAELIAGNLNKPKN